MKVMIVNCHTANRGDEAAVHALVDKLIENYPDIDITVAVRGNTFYPNFPKNVTIIPQYVVNGMKMEIEYCLLYLTKGKLKLSNTAKQFFKYLDEADLVLHGPGGPSIGDVYLDAEPTYLKLYDLLIRMNKPYMFYAPSMGPFKNGKRKNWRKRVLLNAKEIVLRDPVSKNYVDEFLKNDGKESVLTLDSALQYDINLEENEKTFLEYQELIEFLDNHEKCVGITITDLTWHPVHSKNIQLVNNIKKSFSEFLEYLEKNNYGVVFIPQLYGNDDDEELMKKYMRNSKNYFVIEANNPKYDTYFQQYVIGKLYAVIGMRYHSNIFSAKMGTPFISVSYEQKMSGFMKKMGLENYLINISDLSFDNLKDKFRLLSDNYEEYHKVLCDKNEYMKKESSKTTEIVKEYLNKIARI